MIVKSEMAAVDQKSSPLTIIQPSKGWIRINFLEIWSYRELFYFLVWRDIKVRYKQSLLGAGWAILQPLLTMIVFTIFFGNWAGIPTDDIAKPVFYFAGILPWQLFQSGVSKAGVSLVANRNLITKVYFPRLTVPIAPIIAGLVDFAIACLVLIALMIYYGIRPTSALWATPIFIIMAVFTASGVGMWLAALNVTYRDIGYVIPFLLQLWFFLSPVVYSSSIIPEWFKPFYALNPMAGVVSGFRWAILGVGQPEAGTLIASFGISLILLVSGIFYFRRMERTFADVV